MKGLRIAECCISWVIIPPLFYVLMKKYFRWKEIWLTLVTLAAPLCIVAYIFLYVIVYFLWNLTYALYIQKYHYADPDVIEELTQMRFPETRIRRYDCKEDILGEHLYFPSTIVMDLKEVPDEEAMNQLDSLYQKTAVNWKLEGNSYQWWGVDERNKYVHVKYDIGSDSLVVTYQDRP